MKNLKKFVKLFVSFAMVLSMMTVTSFAAEKASVQLYASVEDNGEAVGKAVITYDKNVKVSNVTKDTYKVHATASTTAIREGTEDTSYGDYDIDRTIEKVEVSGNTVTVYFSLTEGATLAYLSSARNYPADLTYTVEQVAPITTSAMDGRVLDENCVAEYTVNETIIDEETAKFESVIVEGGINYQLYVPENPTSLIVWFHGNGEGDYLHSNNNVAQMLANRGTVAWATDEAQSIFGNAVVMAFQAPDTWYYAQTQGLLAKAHDEIMEVVKANNIDPERIAVSGCSAGGYMTTRMIIAYPELFKAAMINCPALDVASVRGGETPTDEELAGIVNAKTAIWLVQGETDSSVGPDACSKRMWSFLSEGKEVTTTEFKGTAGIASDFTTYETTDGTYKLSLYKTVDTEMKEGTVGGPRLQGKLVFAEDQNQDGVLEEVKFSDHWSWIYTLRNNPEAATGEHIWQWAAAKLNEEAIEATATLTGKVLDNGQVVTSMTITFPEGTDLSKVTKDTFTVHAEAETKEICAAGEGTTSYGDYSIDRTIVGVKVEGTKVTLEFDESNGATLAYLASARNYPANLTYTVTSNEMKVNVKVDNTVNDPETAKFESVIVPNGVNYQFYKPEGEADTLIVWYHGNGEGDYLSSNNNVAQMLANRGTVAWATGEAQEIFGNAYVMAFQAPDTWYYAQRDGLLAKTHDEIMDVVKANGIDPEKIVVSGCSAGGYMSTRMIIEYPDLFKAAMINCPALDVADVRGGQTPTDEELKGIVNAKTAIWLVQGETDSSVGPDACSKRMWSFLSEGKDVTETKFAGTANIASGFTTYETKDGTYKLSLYETVDTEMKEGTVGGPRLQGKLKFAEDFNKDGVLEEVKFSDHWSWIYTLVNNPEAASGEHIWQWAASKLAKAEQPTTPDQPGTEGGNTTGGTTTNPSKPNVGIYNNVAYVAIATVALAGAAYVAFKKKED